MPVCVCVWGGATQACKGLADKLADQERQRKRWWRYSPVPVFLRQQEDPSAPVFSSIGWVPASGFSSLQVTERGKAEAADLRPGDIIVAINGESAESMLHAEAQSKIRQSASPLRLQLDR